ncbi:MerR family transcriptional regulator [Undibacterium sp.]|uniref:MerR family transcriptional regulator n=1 Tax=Undibacterium sp. TaxID=1914977 RepID=UPI0037517547
MHLIRGFVQDKLRYCEKMSEFFKLATISNETGIAKEVLRKWETRYGFPVPLRDSSGHRVFSAEQVSRLKLIKQLMNSGLRPGHLVPLDEASLIKLTGASQTESALQVPLSSELQHLMTSLPFRDPVLLRETLKSDIERTGLEQFLLNTMPALSQFIGEAWVNKVISVSDEHLYSEIMQNLLRAEIAKLVPAKTGPRILLTTPTGELHTLGLLMLEASFTLHGGRCVSLGAQLPLTDIVIAIETHKADIACLSFSAVYPKKDILPLLKKLRTMVPSEVDIWVGGAGSLALERSPRGIVMMKNLLDGVTTLKKYIKRK